jgi:hypothetical protein
MRFYFDVIPSNINPRVSIRAKIHFTPIHAFQCGFWRILAQPQKKRRPIWTPLLSYIRVCAYLSKNSSNIFISRTETCSCSQFSATRQGAELEFALLVCHPCVLLSNWYVPQMGRKVTIIFKKRSEVFLGETNIYKKAPEHVPGLSYRCLIRIN